jgi:hypothetical protein
MRPLGVRQIRIPGRVMGCFKPISSLDLVILESSQRGQIAISLLYPPPADMIHTCK